jgi:hypothetical protein
MISGPIPSPGSVTMRGVDMRREAYESARGAPFYAILRWGT